MNEYWLVFDRSTGRELWRGGGAEGSSAIQPLPEGAALLIVPQQVVAAPELNLGILRDYLAARVDQEAEAVRQRFLTPGEGQMATYLRKEQEARALALDPDASTPFLKQEAEDCGMTIAAVAAEVIIMVDSWVSIGKRIEGKRRGAKVRLAAAITLGEIVAAADLDWSTIHAPAA